VRVFAERAAAIVAVPLLLVLTARLAGAQDHDHEGGTGGPRVVETHRWTDPEGRLMAFYSAALAFSPVGAPRMVTAPWGGTFGLELSYVPSLSQAQRSAGFSKTESTNLAPVIPRPRFALTLPAGFSIEGSWIPPMRAFGVRANVFGAAIARPFTIAGNVILTPRIAGSTGSVKGPITCNDDLEAQSDGDALFYLHVCHGMESEDRFEPDAFSGEVVATRLFRGGAIAPYAGVGVRREQTTFDVGVRYTDGSIDPNHPILELDLTRAYGFLGASWAGPLRSALSAEMFYAPSSLLTARIQASMRLFGS
jgi:hypothetical protein